MLRTADPIGEPISQRRSIASPSRFSFSVFGHPFLGFLFLVATLTFGSPSFAAKFNKVIDIGKPAPTWKDLDGVDGRRHGLEEFKDAKLVVVVFACNHCPVVKAYESRLIRFVDDYRDQGVELVAISVSLQESDRLEQMKVRASERGYNFSYLIDPTQKIARAFGATCTPHVFVLDAKRRIAYMGKIDDNMEPDKVETRYLRDAVDALLAGKEPEVAETRQIGCEIEYQNVATPER